MNGKEKCRLLRQIRREIAEKIYERHTELTNFLTLIGVDPDTASKDACKIEHDLSDTTFQAIKAYMENLE